LPNWMPRGRRQIESGARPVHTRLARTDMDAQEE
jgi:hypothetical protein